MNSSATVRYIYDMTFKRMVGLAVVVMVVGGGYLPAHAQAACNSYSSANCWIRQDEANDPGYQSAVRGGWGYNYGYSSSYGSPYNYPYSDYSYTNRYTSQYPTYNYQYSDYSYSQGRRLIDSYSRGGCDYEVWNNNGHREVTGRC